MEAGKRRLAGDTARAATTGEVQDLRREARALKECVADLTLENRLLKKSMIADGGDDEGGIPHLKSSRSSGSSSSRICRRSSLSTSWGSHAGRSTVGTTGSSKADRRRWRIGHRHRAAYGTGSRLTSMIRSSNWRWSSPS